MAVAVPATPAGKIFALWLDAANGSRESYEHLREPYKNGGLLPFDAMLQLLAQTGGIDVVRVESIADTHISVTARAREAEQFFVYEITVEPEPPYLVTKRPVFRVIPRPAEFAPVRLPEADLLAALRARLDELAAADKFAGAVLLAKNGAPIFTTAYGLADRARSIPNTLDTQFRNGSMNKMFTATAMVRLIQDGAASLADPLGKYLPDYPDKDIANVTIEHLLTHTGGTGDIFGPEFMKHRLELHTHTDYLAFFGARAPLFEPGAKFLYSNYGFVLLGALIEKISGQDYYDHVRERVYAPAGMTATGSLPGGEVAAEISVGYAWSKDGLQPNTDTLLYRGMAAGGGYTTVGDLLKFANALRDLKLVDARHLDLMTTGKVGDATTKYCFGFTESDGGTRLRQYGHNGGAPGMNGDLRIFPHAGYTIAALSNLDPPAAGRVASFISDRLPIA